MRPLPRWLSLAVVLGVLSACSSSPLVHGPGPSPGAGGASGGGECNPVGDIDCGNTINALVLPLLAQDGITPSIAADTELCRRYSIDLVGVAPSWQEYQDHCQGKSPAEMADYFLAQPGYVRLNQRLWADALQLDNRQNWYQYTIDLDAQVARLYQGQLSYPDFTAIAVAHPAFVSKFVGENVVAYAYLAFLGRDALSEERQDLLSLYRMWMPRQAYDPALTTFNGQTTNYKEMVINPMRCAGPLGAINCTSNLFHATVRLDGTAVLTLSQLSPAQWETLRTPGRMLATLPYYWEAAVDNVLHKYLGWWHGGYQLPGYELPEVRQALALLFQQGAGDIRLLEREVLTSVLYIMPAKEAQGDVKFWHYGPSKQMIAEAWLDSVARFTGVDLGVCDWRFPNLAPRWLPRNLVPPRGQIGGFDYQAEARTMGGCPDQEGQFRYTEVGVLYAMEQRDVLASVCSASAATAFLPPAGTDASGLVRLMYQRALLVDPGPDELQAVAGMLPGANAQVARNLCQAVLRSGRFLFY